MRQTILPWQLWAVLILSTFVLILRTGDVLAEPLYAAEVGGIKITLHDDKCSLPAVENLGQKATWSENGRVFDGCWGGHPQYPILMFYFADKTVVVIPVQAFKKLTGV